MELEQRIEQLEHQLAEQNKKRRSQVLEHMALRAVTIEALALISTSSAWPHTLEKSRVANRLTNELMAGEWEQAATQEALEALEDLFYEIDAARTAAGHAAQTPS